MSFFAGDMARGFCKREAAAPGHVRAGAGVANFGEMAAVLSAGIIPVYRKKEAPRVLLLRAYRNWDFPKGVVEWHEKPLEAALRELREETLMTDVRFPWGYAYRETPYLNRDKIARYYLAECPDLHVELPISPELGMPEHHEYRWVSFAEARTLVGPRVLPVIDWAEAQISLVKTQRQSHSAMR